MLALKGRRLSDAYGGRVLTRKPFAS